MSSTDVERLMERARERLAEHDAYRTKERANGFTGKDRMPEFCGAFRELLDMLVTELEREAEPCEHLDNAGRPYEPSGWAHASMHDDR